jgi:exosortase
MTRFLIVIILAALAGLTIYLDAIIHVMSEVLNRSDSSHGVFVPFLAAFFLWSLRDRLRETDTRFSWAGAALAAACLALSLAWAEALELQFVLYIGLVCGLVWALLGGAMFRIVAFPLVFLITMTPLPQDLYNRIADLSRTIAFGGSLKILSLLGIPHFREGWYIQLPNAVLLVNHACSGIRYLISYVVFGFAYAFLYKSSFAGRSLTVLAAIPLSIMASIGRLTIIFALTYWVSPFWSQHRPHVILSWFVFFGFLLLAIAVDQWLGRKKEVGKLRSSEV